MTLSNVEKYFVTEIVHNGDAITCSKCDGRGRS